MFTVDFRDPGMKSRLLNLNTWDEVDVALQQNSNTFTSVEIRDADGLHLCMWRPVGYAAWLPYNVREWFKEFLPDSI